MRDQNNRNSKFSVGLIAGCEASPTLGLKYMLDKQLLDCKGGWA